MQKFKMAAQTGVKTIFGKIHSAETLWVKNSVKISLSPTLLR